MDEWYDGEKLPSLRALAIIGEFHMRDVDYPEFCYECDNWWPCRTARVLMDGGFKDAES